MELLLLSAILPIAALCWFVYKKDPNKEPTDLLMKLLGFGALSTIPVIIAEIFFSPVRNEKSTSFLAIFIGTFIGVALIEEGFKWIFVKTKAYNNREFDEIYDIIVYSVFVSLGFAGIENILYVVQYGLGTAILRAVLSVPGHACFAVFMGYYFSKAKVASISHNQSLYIRNMVFSLLVPTLFHTMYDALITWYSNTQQGEIVIYFLLFDVMMVVIGFIIVNKTSKVQQSLYTNIEEGTLVNNQGKLELQGVKDAKFCPLCGNNVTNSNYCSRCGLKIR